MQTFETQSPAGQAVLQAGPSRLTVNHERAPILHYRPACPYVWDDRRPALLDLVTQGRRYADLLGLVPLAYPHLDSHDLHYVAGPLVVCDHGKAAVLPAWLLAAIRPARLGLLLAGQKEMATEEEVLVYLLTDARRALIEPEWQLLRRELALRVPLRWTEQVGAPPDATVRDDENMASSLEFADRLQRFRRWLLRRVVMLARRARGN